MYVIFNILKKTLDSYIPKRWRVGEMCKGVNITKISSNTINNPWGCNARHGDYS